jgi:hypothetical protein
MNIGIDNQFFCEMQSCESEISAYVLLRSGRGIVGHLCLVGSPTGLSTYMHYRSMREER